MLTEDANRTHMIESAIQQLLAGEPLSAPEIEAVAGRMMAGEATPVQMAAFLTALRMRGERIADVVAFARVLRERARAFNRPDGVVVDTCGTGGDHLGTFNISTAAALVAAGAGVRVAKHGNRSSTSKCGSADVLQELGVRLDAPPEVMERALATAGICFLFAQHYHQSMRHVAPVRRELPFRTVFNLVGPLANPARTSRQLIGVFEPGLVEVYAMALAELGCERGMVVHGEEGLDEISITGGTTFAEVRDGALTTGRLTPEEFGMTPGTIDDIRGGDAAVNARIILDVLGGEAGPRADIVALNAGAALLVAGAVPDMASGVAAARASLRSGAAMRALEQLREITNQD